TIDDSEKEKARAAEYHIERCNYARELMASPVKFTTDTLSVESDLRISCFNPLVTVDENELVYMDQFKFYDAVMISERKDSKWLTPMNLTPVILSDGDHYATGISADGKTLLFTSYDPYRSGEIYASYYRNESWTPMHKLNDEINTVFNETHASLSPDGNVLYFTSDRKGGYGASDIYMSVRNSQGEWGKAVNLGPLINTPYNEESPFVTPDGSRLFFSSQGHYNMGGFDIFYSRKDLEGNWLPPVNAGYPLNTTDDDLFFFPVSNGNAGYQSRFAENSAESELVHYHISSFGNPVRFMVNGKIDINDPDCNPSSISVRFIETDVNDTITVKPLNEDGSFRQKLASGNYQIDFSDQTNLLLSRHLEIPDYFPHNNLVFHESITVATAKYADTVYLRDVLFEFNTFKPVDEYNREIESIVGILQKYPEVTIRISGYADAIGSKQFNLKLSTKRANMIKEILEKRIQKSLRIITIPFGESNPVAINRNRDGSDNPEGRRYNRRVEIQFIDLPDSLHIIRVSEVPVNLRHN
ncbi:MAG TPA: OmpA family protein, partial [Bacteroidales bacterium]|nr:OmpA family protein [Bacteroidales bacterium]